MCTSRKNILLRLSQVKTRAENGFIYAVRYCHMDQNAYRQSIVLQYFELRIALNKANGLKDDKTHLEFELRSDDDEGYVIIKSSGAHHGLRIATHTKRKYWMAFQDSKYSELNKYLSLGIKSISDPAQINEKLTIWLFKLWVV
jgi:aromatic ring-cleaving dioxygenase